MLPFFKNREVKSANNATIALDSRKRATKRPLRDENNEIQTLSDWRENIAKRISSVSLESKTSSNELKQLLSKDIIDSESQLATNFSDIEHTWLGGEKRYIYIQNAYTGKFSKVERDVMLQYWKQNPEYSSLSDDFLADSEDTVNSALLRDNDTQVHRQVKEHTLLSVALPSVLHAMLERRNLAFLESNTTLHNRNTPNKSSTSFIYISLLFYQGIFTGFSLLSLISSITLQFISTTKLTQVIHFYLSSPISQLSRVIMYILSLLSSCLSLYLIASVVFHSNLNYSNSPQVTHLIQSLRKISPVFRNRQPPPHLHLSSSLVLNDSLRIYWSLSLLNLICYLSTVNINGMLVILSDTTNVSDAVAYVSEMHGWIELRGIIAASGWMLLCYLAMHDVELLSRIKSIGH